MTWSFQRRLLLARLPEKGLKAVLAFAEKIKRREFASPFAIFGSSSIA